MNKLPILDAIRLGVPVPRADPAPPAIARPIAVFNEIDGVLHESGALHRDARSGRNHDQGFGAYLTCEGQEFVDAEGKRVPVVRVLTHPLRLRTDAVLPFVVLAVARPADD